MKQSVPGIFTRMGHLWTRFDFVDQVILKDKSSAQTLFFWFFWNTVLVLFISLIFTFQFQDLFLQFEETGKGLLLQVQEHDPEQFQQVFDLWKQNPDAFALTLGGSSFLVFWFLLAVARILPALFMAWLFWLWGNKGMGKKNLTYGHTFLATLHVAILPLIFAVIFLINNWFRPELYLLIGVFIMGMNLRNIKTSNHHDPNNLSPQ